MVILIGVYSALVCFVAIHCPDVLIQSIGTFGQLSGNGLITYFLPVLLEQAGITNQNRRLTLNFVNSVTSYIGGE